MRPAILCIFEMQKTKSDALESTRNLSKLQMEKNGNRHVPRT